MKFNEFKSAKALNEAYITGWGTSDQHDIRAHVIESLIEWYDDNGWDQGLFIELLTAYMYAIGAKANESPEMAAVMKHAEKLVVREYKELAADNTHIGEWSDELREAFDNLSKIGFNDKVLGTLKKHLEAEIARDTERYKRENPDEFDEAEVWDQPNPKKKHTKLSPAKKAAAKARAKRAGRPYPNLIDNMWASKK